MKTHSRELLAALLFLALLPLLCFGASEKKVKIKMLSIGDEMENRGSVKGGKQNYNTKARTEESLRRLKERGYTVIYWRMLWGVEDDEILHYSYRHNDETAQAKKEFENTPYAWDPVELRWPIEVAHRLGMKLYAWVDPHNMGAPPGAWAELGMAPSAIPFPTGLVYDTQFPWQFKSVHDNPQYQLVDRKGQRYYYGVMEWAYPEARRYWTGNIKRVLDKYDVDGIYMDTRTESMAPDYADQFGFNEPIVQEYKRRYGVDILHEDFDLESWRQLRGEYFTLFLKEVSEVIHSKGKVFSLGTARGDYIGFPLGNMKLEWRKWISEKTIDELHLDEQGWAWGRHGYGYVTDRVTGRGLQPIDVMVREGYGPLCRKNGVKLYFKPHAYPGKDEEWKRRTAEMAEFDGVIE